SGCGKTTLLSGLLGLAPVSALARQGDIRLRGEAWPANGSAALQRLLREDALFLPQDAQQALDPFARVGDFVAAWSGADPARRAAACDALELEALARRRPHELSGGQAQRVLLALALARRPSLLVMDEPTASLDQRLRDRVVSLLGGLRSERGTALLL